MVDDTCSLADPAGLHGEEGIHDKVFMDVSLKSGRCYGNGISFALRTS